MCSGAIKHIIIIHSIQNKKMTKDEIREIEKIGHKIIDKNQELFDKLAEC